jgi:hypothetical protein
VFIRGEKETSVAKENIRGERKHPWRKKTSVALRLLTV